MRWLMMEIVPRSPALVPIQWMWCLHPNQHDPVRSLPLALVTSNLKAATLNLSSLFEWLATLR